MKEELLKAFQALAPKVYEAKVSLENNEAAVAISSILSEPQGLCLIEYLIDKLSYGKQALYLTGEFISRDRLRRLIETSYQAGEQEALKILLVYYDQIWIYSSDNPIGFHDAAQKLTASAATNSTTVTLKLCLDCSRPLDSSLTECNFCSNSNLLEILELVLAEPARVALKQGQFLELYVKECLAKCGTDLIGYSVSQRGPKGYIGVEYQVQGEPVEIDVHGFAQPLTILLCEVKTAQKITLNELRRVENVLQGLLDRVNNLSQLNASYRKLFVITGEFDQNIPRKTYVRKNWELIDREAISNLVEELKRIQQEL